MNARKRKLKLYELMHVLRHEYQGSYKWIAYMLDVPLRTVAYHIAPKAREKHLKRSTELRAQHRQSVRRCRRCDGKGHYAKTCRVSLSV